MHVCVYRQTPAYNNFCEKLRTFQMSPLRGRGRLPGAETGLSLVMWKRGDGKASLFVNASSQGT